MSRPHDWNWKAAAAGFLSPLLMSLGMSLSLLRALLPDQPVWPAALLCLGFTLLFHALFSLRFRGKWLLPLGAVLLLSLWGALGGGPGFRLVQMVKAGFLAFRGIQDAVGPYADTARWTVCLVFSLLAAALAWDRMIPLAIFTVASVAGLSYLFSGREQALFFALPGAAGLLMLTASERGKRLSALPVALLLSIGAFLLLPVRTGAVSPFKEASEKVRQFVEDYLLFNEYRSAFSLTSEGYLPLDTRLGGPAEPKEHNVMEVTADRTVLLRGKTYDDYSGLNWYDSLSARRYLALSPRFTSLKENLFDLNRPLSGEDSMEKSTLRVHILDEGTTTLFSPCRTRSLQLEGERMVLYYNMASEWFITRNLQPGDAYTVTYLPYVPGTKATGETVAACQGLSDPHYQEIAEKYLTVPRHIQQDIYDIAARATAGCSTPYEKALGIQNYLRNNYRYTLNVKTPPDGVDFVAWFLIGEKQGYCTYFATAMTMLCRIAGLPARYVTGYLAVPEDGLAVVTGKDAHAWTEVYLNGFGWLDFDATPRTDSDRGGDSDAASDPPPSAPSPSPEPSKAPTPQPTPEPTPEPTSEPDDRQGDEEKSEKTPTPEPSADQPQSKNDPPPETGGGRDFPWWIFLILLLILLLIIWRYLATEPLRQADRHPERAAEILFAAILGLLSLRGMKRLPQETLAGFARRADQELEKAGLSSVSPLADAYGAHLYGRHPVPEAPFRETYRTLRSSASFWKRLLFDGKRMVRFGKHSIL